MVDNEKSLKRTSSLVAAVLGISLVYPSSSEANLSGNGYATSNKQISEFRGRANFKTNPFSFQQIYNIVYSNSLPNSSCWSLKNYLFTGRVCGILINNVAYEGKNFDLRIVAGPNRQENRNIAIGFFNSDGCVDSLIYEENGFNDFPGIDRISYGSYNIDNGAREEDNKCLERKKRFSLDKALEKALETFNSRQNIY